MMLANVRGDTTYLYILYILYMRDARCKECKESKGDFATLQGLKVCSCRKGDAAGGGDARRRRDGGIGAGAADSICTIAQKNLSAANWGGKC